MCIRRRHNNNQDENQDENQDNQGQNQDTRRLPSWITTLLVTVAALAITLGAIKIIEKRSDQRTNEVLAERCRISGGTWSQKAEWCIPPTTSGSDSDMVSPAADSSESQSIPNMEWSNGTLSRSYEPVWVTDRYEWWMNGYNHLDAGEVFVPISDFKEVTFNSVADEPGYVIEVLDKNKNTVHVFAQHANNFNDNIWFTVETNWETLHIKWPNPNNQSNGCVVFARP